VVPVWTITGLAASDAFTGISMAAVIDPTASAGTIMGFTPTGGSLTSGLASNYILPATFASGYVVVLPTQASALAGDNSTQNVFFVQLNADEISNAIKALDQQRSAVSGVGPVFFDGGSLIPPAGPAQGGVNAQRQAADFLQGIKESTPALLELMRRMPLLQWDESRNDEPVNISDSGVVN
jgi:hypothetical protein